MEHNNELWDLFTVKEEYTPAIRDKYGRRNYWSSKNRNIFKPVVSEYLVGAGVKPQYPDKKRFALCLTHDIDHLFEPLKSFSATMRKTAKSLTSLNIKAAAKTLSEAKSRKISSDYHIRETLKYEKRYNARSASYFLSLTEGEEDFNYKPSEIASIYEEITANKGEIGLHGGHNAYNDIARIKQERERLELAAGMPVTGYRNHYLRFETPLTWKHLDELQFKYDTTFGYPDCSGFRNGMCHPFNPYDVNKGQFLDIMEIPLVIMDTTLGNSYMRLDAKSQFQLCKQLIDTVAANHGAVSLLWHNSAMQGAWGEMYDAILKYADGQNAWMPTGNEMIDFWKENNFHKDVKDLLSSLKTN